MATTLQRENELEASQPRSTRRPSRAALLVIEGPGNIEGSRGISHQTGPSTPTCDERRAAPQLSEDALLPLIQRGSECASATALAWSRDPTRLLDPLVRPSAYDAVGPQG